MYQYAGIVVNNESVQVDKIFTYKIPENLINKLKIGHRVKVPFGKGNRNIDGFVMELYENFHNNYKIKPIINICDNFTVFREEDVDLIKRMREKYLCTYLECIKVIIPTGIIKGIKNKVKEVIYIGNNPTGKFYNKPYINIYEIVKLYNGLYTKTEISKKFNVSLSSINTMIKHGFLQKNETIVNRFNNRVYSNYEEKKLNEEQQVVVDSILNSNKKLFLIHGITGSGKTEIYMNMVKHMINQSKESIILVPEISLTPQMVERFKGRFGKDIAVFHSKLSDGERYDEWLRIKNKQVKVAIGARSAIFLPFNNLGMIIIDEEHEGSYKSDSNPKYNAREIGEFKCEIEGCKLVLGSATPSIDTYYRSMKDEIQLLTLKNRADGAKLPDVFTVDMRDELKSGNKSIFSNLLYEGIEEALNNKEQIILFLNRRGFSTFVSCRECGYVFKCNHCDIALTYHSKGNYLSCHYCGERYQVPHTCHKCGSKYVKYFGVGTERIEKEVKKYFPSARTLRMDFDTTRKKDSYEYIYNTFKNGDADILIGTQMVTKGLDFKNVTLVGVIAADISLNLPDFRSGEKTFQLITQVGGRAGRGEKRGKVIVQTYSPENYSIICSSNNDYDNFYKEEIEIRYNLNYPPFSKILAINISSKNENLLIKNIQKIGIILKNNFEKDNKIDILGPCPCVISKVKEFYRWQILIKGQFNNELALNIKNFVYKNLQDVYNEFRISIDVNPSTLL
ncbi:primosomal protein N' [Clostridium botulinum C]|uniref:Replication restart protein PriA n=3 Tax=Clostridium botulinum TaxID=1491 RepID=A0A9Q4TDP6_CLOBO|nr:MULTISPECIES: primosomal protein N' [Clostridium]MBO3441813.1 primosomal protein N' [Clostridium haemolyticum]MCD3194402.1 primosomal protein N' [Clostridium botulinum C]AYF54753.1 primosomal protein N' [Clostridium novyi]EES90909.1 primosomal protein N' [Clostridium botulinum D str. 1873]MCD3199556.1 primosomal protein N' [Clostridium botulinum C]